MIAVLVICVLISLSAGAPISEDAQASLLRYENNIDGEGNYDFSFETSNGISRKESGRLVNVGEPDEHLVVQGFYSYTDEEGKFVIVRYTADENGYQVEEGVPIYTTPLPPVQAAAPLPPGAIASLLG